MEGQPATKQKVSEAAVFLFNAKGFHGVSVREIATRANVNAALISYYFGGKKGLLEHLMMTFYEGYIQVIEKAERKLDEFSAMECLIETIQATLDYQQEHVRLARFVHREITHDTMLVRELMMTYLMKEKFCYEQIFKTGMERNEFHRLPLDLLVIQFREMLLMPYLHPQYIREIYHLSPQETYFKKRYTLYINEWVKSHVCRPQTLFENKKIVAEA